jgi:hypothetical protein
MTWNTKTNLVVNIITFTGLIFLTEMASLEPLQHIMKLIQGVL